MKSMQSVLDAFPQYREKLYIRGFVLTDGTADESAYPFYGRWRHFDLAGRTLLVHPQQNCSVCVKNDSAAALVGHAYNPISMEARENRILANCLDQLQKEIADRLHEQDLLLKDQPQHRADSRKG